MKTIGKYIRINTHDKEAEAGDILLWLNRFFNSEFIKLASDIVRKKTVKIRLRHEALIMWIITAPVINREVL